MRDYKEVVEKYGPQIYDDLWLFPRRGEGGDPGFHGAFIPQIPQYLAARYTNPGDTVWDPMAGSGTTGDALQDFDLTVYMSDLVPIRPDIRQGDARNYRPAQLMDLIILHPPYHDIIKFSDNPRCLSNYDAIGDFLFGFGTVVRNLNTALMKNGYLALIMGNIYVQGCLVPLPYYCWEEIHRLNYKLKVDYVKDIQGNSQDNTANLWRYRHQRNGTAVFKHEHIMVFKK